MLKIESVAPKTDDTNVLQMGSPIDPEQASLPKILKEEADVPDEIAQPAPGPTKIDFGKDWSSMPSVVDQASLYPESVRKVGAFVKVFDLSNTEQLTEWNSYLQKAQQQAVVLHDVQRNFHEGKYYVYVLVNEFSFRKIIPEPDGPK
jgi:hypothetical protein